MTLLDNYFPFSVGPGATATQAHWRSMARLFYGTGVVPGNQSQMSCTISGTVVTIHPGAVWIDGFYGENDANKTLTGVTGTGMIVARMDPTNNNIYFLFVSGQSVPTQNPTGIFEVPLYTVASGALTDVRQFCNAIPASAARGRMHRAAAFTTSTAFNNFGFDTVDYGVNWSGYTFICPYAADYLCIAQVGFASSAAGQWYNIRLTHGTLAGAYTASYNGTDNSVQAGAAMLVSTTDVVPCKAGETLYIVHNCSTNGLQGEVGPAIAYFTVRALT
jgi:hypothetical protein